MSSRNCSIFSPVSKSNKIYQLKSFLPLSRRLIRIFRPVLVLNLAKNPCRRFCTSREGRYVARLPASEAEAEKERNWLKSGVTGAVVVVAIAVVVLFNERVGRLGEIDEKRELYVRDGEGEDRSHAVGRICGLVGIQ